MKSYDAIVIGMGGMGSAATYHLASRGKHVLGIEQFAPNHMRGSSHGQSRVIRQSYFEHPNYVPLLIRAYRLWEELQSNSGMDLMTLTGGLMIGPPHSQTVIGSHQSALIHQLKHEMLSAQEIRQRFPVLNPSDDVVGLWEANAGFVRPEVCMDAHRQLAQQHGADLHFHEPVIDWSVSADGSSVCVETVQGKYYADSLILTPGAWASNLFKFALPLTTLRQFLFWIEPRGDASAFSVDRFPIYIWETDNGVQFYGFPQHGPINEGIKVAVFYNDDPCDPNQSHPSPDRQLEVQIRDCLRDRIPALSGPILKSVPCIYTNTPDHHFVIGKHPEFPTVTLASPCSGHGFKFCSVIGEILADLAVNHATQHRIEMFSPLRFGEC